MQSYILRENVLSDDVLLLADDKKHFNCYPNQKIDRLVIVMCLNDVEFQSKYVNY
jgi:hypothetical protein